MNEKGIIFSEAFEARVKLSIESAERELHAVLKIKENKLPLLDFDCFSSEYNGSLELSESEKQKIKCKSELKTYTLINCETNGDIIYPRYIIEGDTDDNFNGIEISLSGFSTWFDQYTHFKITESEIKKKIPDNKFDEIVTINDERYQISSNYCCNIKNVEKRNFIVSEYTTIKLLKLNGCVSACEAEELSHEIRRLFSLLLALPLSIEYIWLIDKDSDSRRPFYFASTGGTKVDPFNSPRESFIHPMMIFKNSMWSEVFNSYFSPPTRKSFQTIWSRLPSLFSYAGAWEYELLGHVSILDSYCDFYSKKKGKKLKSADYKELKKSLIDMIDQYSKKLDNDYFDVLESFKNGVNAIGNTSIPTFKEKFYCLLSGIDDDIRSVISFSNEEFAAIKNIRDAAAHGMPVETRDGRNLSFEFAIKDKLLVLLMYLVYRDFGFSSVDFCICLNETFSKFVLNADINSIKRDKLIGSVPFYELDEKNFFEASKSKKIHLGIDYFENENIYQYNSEVTGDMWDWLTNRDNAHRNLLDHVREKMTGTEFSNMEYIPKAYLFYGDEYLDISGVCLITYEKSPYNNASK